MFLWLRINFIVFYVFLPVILYSKCLNANNAKAIRYAFEDIPAFMDYGESNIWEPRAKTTIPIIPIIQDRQQSSFTPVLRSIQKTTYTVDEALKIAKMMVLPEGDAARQKAMKTYGRDTLGMEKIMGEWIKENIGRSVMKPMNLSHRNENKYIGLDKLLAAPGDDQYTLNPQLKLDLPGARFWEVGYPEAKPMATYVPDDLRPQERLLEDPSDLIFTKTQIQNTAKKTQKSPIFSQISKAPQAITKNKNYVATTIAIKLASKKTAKRNDKTSRDKKVKEYYADKRNENNSGRSENENGRSRNEKGRIRHEKGINENAAGDSKIIEVNKEIKEINRKVEQVMKTQLDNIFDNEELRMYDYKSPNWDDMPKLPVFEITTTTPTTTTVSTLFPTQPPQHPMVARAHEQMWKLNMRYLSAFISTLCEIIAVSKEGHATKLLMGLESAMTLYIQQGWLAAVSTRVLRFIEDYVQLVTQMTPDTLEKFADETYYLFLNHSLFEAQTRQIVEEIENWYTIDEGEELLKTLETVAEWPHNGKKPGRVCKEILDALFAPYMRLGIKSQRRQRLIAFIERVLDHREEPARFKANKHQEATINDNFEDSQSRMEKERNIWAKNRFDIVKNSEIEISDDDYENDRIKQKDRDELLKSIKRDFYPIKIAAKTTKTEFLKINNNILGMLDSYINALAPDQKNNTKNNKFQTRVKDKTTSKHNYDTNNYQRLGKVKFHTNKFEITMSYKDFEIHKREKLQVNDHVKKYKKDVLRNVQHSTYRNSYMKEPVERKLHQFSTDHKNTNVVNVKPDVPFYYENIHSQNKNKKITDNYKQSEPSKNSPSKIYQIFDIIKNLKDKYFGPSVTSPKENKYKLRMKDFKTLPNINKKVTGCYGQTMYNLQEYHNTHNKNKKEVRNLYQKVIPDKFHYTKKPDRSHFEVVSNIEKRDDNEKIHQKFNENFKLNKEVRNENKHILEDSSYSDVELDIKSKLSDALRHDNEKLFRISRRSMNVPEKNRVRDVTSESDQEGVLKNNIYREFSVNRTIHNETEVSDVEDNE